MTGTVNTGTMMMTGPAITETMMMTGPVITGTMIITPTMTGIKENVPARATGRGGKEGKDN
ncbi:hypothetical protein HA066_24000 [Escherichia coli]|nr:hypothetical protein [Escherichia coli]